MKNKLERIKGILRRFKAKMNRGKLVMEKPIIWIRKKLKPLIDFVKRKAEDTSNDLNKKWSFSRKIVIVIGGLFLFMIGIASISVYFIASPSIVKSSIEKEIPFVQTVSSNLTDLIIQQKSDEGNILIEQSRRINTTSVYFLLQDTKSEIIQSSAPSGFPVDKIRNLNQNIKEEYSSINLNIGGTEYFEIAVPVKDGINQNYGLLRVGFDKTSITQMVKSLNLKVAIILSVIAVLGILLVHNIIKVMTKPFDNVSKGISSIANNIVSSMNIIKAGSEKLKDGSEKQVIGYNQTTDSIRKTRESFKQNLKSTYEVTHASEKSKISVKSGLEKTALLRGFMNNIKTSNNEIATVLKAIDNIAFNTNILAINASIEAARAGELGAGFEVVAQEVRRLANMTSESAKKTEEIIKKSIEITKQGYELSDVVENALNEIRENYEMVNSSIYEIKENSEKQTAGIDKIYNEIEEMEKITNENTELSQESTYSIDGMGNLVSDLEKIAKTQNQILDGEKNKLNKIKLK